MAVASSRQPPASVQQLTPPSSAHGGRGSWDFAVPLDSAKNYYPEQEPFMSEDVTPAHPYSPRQPLATQPNGAPKQPRSDAWQHSQRQYWEEEQEHDAQNPVKEPNKNGATDIGAGSSDPDSTLDYYKKPDNKNGTTAKSRGKKKSAKKPANWVEAEKDQNNWIHRDKLKEIETRELEEAGFKVGRSSRSNSRSQSAGRVSRDRANSEVTDPVPNDDRPDNHRVISPIPIEADDEEGDAKHSTWGDLRTSEEIAMEREQFAAHNHVIRPSTSRIPVAKTSPLPVPHTFVERDQPLPRPRNGSGNWDSIATNGARVRSGSTSSQVLLDEPGSYEEAQKSPAYGNIGSPTSATSGPQTKAKTPRKTSPTSGARKTSVQKSQPKSRTTSGSSPVKRPTTSGGSLSRPSTSHRPEGEAPWIATMYKPDPRLPPDQQIIPTHAKRMQQEQWENEGRVGSMYDKDFRLQNTEEFKDKRSSQIQPIDIEKAQEDQQWPLPSPTKPTPERIDTNIKSPTNEQSSYKLTPTIPQSPRVASRSSGRLPAPTTSSKPTSTVRVPEPPAETEKEKEKKNCCCIVM